MCAGWDDAGGHEAATAAAVAAVQLTCMFSVRLSIDVRAVRASIQTQRPKCECKFMQITVRKYRVRAYVCVRIIPVCSVAHTQNNTVYVRRHVCVHRIA